MKKLLISICILTFFLIPFNNVYAEVQQIYELINHDRYNINGFAGLPDTTLNISSGNPQFLVFSTPVNISHITNDSSTNIKVRFTDVNGVTSVVYDYATLPKDTLFENIRSIRLTTGGSYSTLKNLKVYGHYTVALLNSQYNPDVQEYTYDFAMIPIVNANIIVKNSKGELVNFTKTITNKTLKLKFNNLVTGDYTIESFQVDNNIDSSIIINTGLKTFTIEEPLSFIQKVIDTVNNVITYIFNKDISVEKSDIQYLDSNNVQQEFDYSVQDNKLNIFINSIKDGKFRIQPIKVNSADGKESVTNIPIHSYEILGLQLLNRNFGQHVPKDIENLIFTFNKQLSSASVTLKDLTNDIIIDTSTVIMNDKLIVDYDTLSHDTEYQLILNSVIDTNGSKLENIDIRFKTLKSTGNSGIDTIISEFLNIFTQAQNTGLKIVIIAILTGIIFIVSSWLWLKLRRWVKIM
jgi:hypothetical protein